MMPGCNQEGAQASAGVFLADFPNQISPLCTVLRLSFRAVSVALMYEAFFDRMKSCSVFLFTVVGFCIHYPPTIWMEASIYSDQCLVEIGLKSGQW